MQRIVKDYRSFHSSFRKGKEDEWISVFIRGLESEQMIAEVIDATSSRSRSSMFNEEEENNSEVMMDSLETREVDEVDGQGNVPEYQETNEFVPQENANVDHFVPQENENAEQFVPPVEQGRTKV